ncbi:hypothetical protein AB0M32_35060 [Streptomyces sp. NPDC051985]|uniref:hypothetical protein n=1 Tax=Streptomyces sp. NPDC051985 TaxID=3155807 RepID=UPI00343FE3AE
MTLVRENTHRLLLMVDQPLRELHDPLPHRHLRHQNGQRPAGARQFVELLRPVRLQGKPPRLDSALVRCEFAVRG